MNSFIRSCDCVTKFEPPRTPWFLVFKMLFSSSSSCLFSSLLLSFVLSSVLSWNYCYGYAWSGLLDPDTAIDWSNPGVGDIPTRPSQCATLSPSATLDEINAALAACTQGQAVFLSAGV